MSGGSHKILSWPLTIQSPSTSNPRQEPSCPIYITPRFVVKYFLQSDRASVLKDLVTRTVFIGVPSPRFSCQARNSWLLSLHKVSRSWHKAALLPCPTPVLCRLLFLFHQERKKSYKCAQWSPPSTHGSASRPRIPNLDCLFSTFTCGKGELGRVQSAMTAIEGQAVASRCQSQDPTGARNSRKIKPTYHRLTKSLLI
jgi:hypothetical protein